MMIKLGKENSMNKSIKKYIAGLAAVLMIFSSAGCGQNGVQPAPAADDTSSSQSVEQTDEQNTAQASSPLSVPVKLNADGDIDMDAALSYETDLDALIAKLEAKTKDDSRTVSENTNPETLALYK